MDFKTPRAWENNSYYCNNFDGDCEIRKSDATRDAVPIKYVYKILYVPICTN